MSIPVPIKESSAAADIKGTGSTSHGLATYSLFPRLNNSYRIGNNLQRISGTLGANIRKRRLAQGLTQEELSGQADIHYTFLGHIERGNRLPSLLCLYRIAAALRVNLSEILRGV
jgi:DNA-binding XRE family transcriptional regulator